MGVRKAVKVFETAMIWEASALWVVACSKGQLQHTPVAELDTHQGATFQLVMCSSHASAAPVCMLEKFQSAIISVPGRQWFHLCSYNPQMKARTHEKSSPGGNQCMCILPSESGSGQSGKQLCKGETPLQPSPPAAYIETGYK